MHERRIERDNGLHRSADALRNASGRANNSADERARNFTEICARNFADGFVINSHDRLQRTRVVISWIENIGGKIAQGMRFVTAGIAFWNSFAAPHLRIV